MSGEYLHIHLKKLSEFFHDSPLDEVEEIFELEFEKIKKRKEKQSTSENQDNSDEDDDDVPFSNFNRGGSLKFGLETRQPAVYCLVEKALNDFGCLNLLQEFYNEAVLARKEPGFKEYDSWDFLIKHVNKEKYLSFMYACICLWQLEPANPLVRKLSCNTGRVYLILLTVPGAKQCGIFDEDLVVKAFQLLNLFESLKRPEVEKFLQYNDRVQVQLFLGSFLDDLKMILKIVLLEEFTDVKKLLVNTLKGVLFLNHVNGYENFYCYNLHKKCFEVLEVLCLPIHGDVVESIYTVFCITSTLYVPKLRNAPKKKSQFPTEEKNPYGETVVEFFFYMLNQFSAETSTVLTRFIQATLTNPDTSLPNDDFNLQLDIGVQYEAEMFKKCNTSMVPWLEQLANSKEIIHRSNAAEFLGKMLLVDSAVEWTLFEHEVSSIPREIQILKILFEKIIDVNNGVKQKALNSLIKAFNSGNKNVIDILQKAFSNEVQKEYEEISTEIKGLIVKILHLLNNQSAHIRRAAILLIEILATKNRDMIDSLEFKNVILKLPDDPTTIVRRQSLIILNKLLENYPNRSGLIELWTQCFLTLIKDSDSKIVELAMTSLKTHVFDKIQIYEKTKGGIHTMPWEILRSVLKLGDRNILKNVVDEWAKTKAINQKFLSVIESHIYSSNSVEALLLLSLIAKKMKSKNPDALVNAFCASIQSDMYNSPITLHLILEIISCWIPDFSRNALNQIYLILFDLLKSGSSSPTLITEIYDVCFSIRAHVKSENEWVHELEAVSKSYIMDKKDEFLQADGVNERYLNYLLLYSDSCVNLSKPPEYEVVQLLVSYVNDAAKERREDFLNTDRVTKMCIVVTVLTRLGVRDIEIASAIVSPFALILKKSTQCNLVSHIITCLTDLCKKHTSCVESSMQEVTNKLKSNNAEIRAMALRSLRELIMQDYIKMRGRVLLNILTAIVDPVERISNAACTIILSCVEEKNKNLLITCFLESVFLYNGYLQYDGFELFPVSEIDNEPSPLQGKERTKERYSLYQFFIDSIDIVPLLILLKNINLINDRLKLKKFVKCSEGTATIQDLLYIFTQICSVKSKLDMKSTENTNPNDEQVSTGINAVDARPTRGAPTMNQAMSIVEKMIAIFPKFYKHVEDYDGSLVPQLDTLSEAIATNFNNFIEFTQPEFWDRHKKAKTPKKRTQRKTSDLESIMTEDDDDASSIFTEDND